MLTAFFESIKYIGHLYPVAFLRIFLGYYWLNQSLIEYQTGLFTSQVFIDQVRSSEYMLSFPSWYRWIFDHMAYPYWSMVSHGILSVCFFVGVSLVIGFLVRPMGVIGIIISFHYVLFSTGYPNTLYSTFIAILVTIVALGAGRCVGFDYYFYKRHRGIWW
jgi:thiosulfate dehydrogenase [quinone] large subunit